MTAVLAGKVAIVTGGSRGVGLGIAQALADHGAGIVICGRTAGTLERAAAEIAGRSGADVLPVVCDVTDASSLADLVERTIARFATIDILVNNAMIVPHGTLLEMDEAVVADAWSSGPLAALRLMRLCHPHLCGGGAIVNVSSAASIQANAQNRGVYAAAKAALNALSRAAANEWGRDGIRVNTIMPLALTDAVREWQEAEPAYAAQVVAGVPLGRVGDPYSDIGRAVAFLAGPDAAYITGATLPLDGGTAYIR